MDTIKVKKNERPELIFNIDVSGTNDPITEIRLTVFDDTHKVSYLGRYRDGKASFRVDEIEKYFVAGIFKYELEVFIGNQYFTPFSGQLEVSEGVKIVVPESPEVVQHTAEVGATFEMRKGLQEQSETKETPESEKLEKVEKPNKIKFRHVVNKNTFNKHREPEKLIANIRKVMISKPFARVGN